MKSILSHRLLIDHRLLSILSIIDTLVKYHSAYHYKLFVLVRKINRQLFTPIQILLIYKFLYVVFKLVLNYLVF